MDKLLYCVVVPVYNHGLTVGRVARDASRYFPVIVVNDGSTDATAEVLESLQGLERVEVISLSMNCGKAGALQKGFAVARKRGFTHAISLDADGQHPVDAVPRLAEASRRCPRGLVVGVRDLRQARAPKERQFSNSLSNFWFRVETGIALGDTQTGLRCYPLRVVDGLNLRSKGYAWELEILVVAAWAGVPLVEMAVGVDYDAPTSRLSHFNPVRDFLRISRLHGWLVLQSLVLSRQVRAKRAWKPDVNEDLLEVG